VKIAIVAEHINQRGGQERVLAELVSRLAKRHQVDLFCFSAADIPRGRVRVHRLWCPFNSSTLQALWMVLLSPLVVRQRKYDVVLSQGGNSLVRNFVLVHTCHADRARALREVRWRYERPSRLVRLGWTLRQAWATWMEGWVVRRCQGRVLAVSQMVVRYLAQEHGLREPPAYAVPNGLDHNIFNLAARRRFRSSRREALQVGPEEFLILFAGGLWFDKGLPLVIDALALMEQPARLVIVGRGDEEFFAQLAHRRGVAERVLFAGVTDRIVEYYAAADCLVMPARGEAFGLVVAEAAACGLPLVTTDIGAADELVEDGVSGFRVEQDPAQIANRLDKLAVDPMLSQRMGTAAYHKAQLLSWDRQADQIEEFFLTHLPEPSSEQLAPEKPAGTAPLALSEAPDPLRVAVISHSCVVDLNQRPYAELRNCADIDLCLFSPRRWWAAVSGEMEFAVLPEIADCAEPLPVWLPGQIHLHWYTSQLAQKLDEFRPDVLFVDEEPYSLAAAQAARLASGLGYKLVVFTKENIQRRLPLPFEWIYKRVLAESDHVFVVSESCAEVLEARGYHGPTTVLPHGVDPTVFAPRPSLPRPREFPQSGAMVGYAGRLDAAKGVWDLLEAAQLAAQRGAPEFSLVLIGGGPLRNKSAKVADRANAKPPVAVIRHVPHHQMPAYLNALDVLVLPSRTTPRWKEQFGRVIIEALACGVPVIGSDSGHIPYLINDTGGGLIFPEGDIEALAQTMDELLSNPGQREALAQRGRQRVLEKYTWSRIAQRVADVLLEIGGRA